MELRTEPRERETPELSPPPPLGHRPRLALQALGEHQREVRRDVAVRRIAGTLELNVRRHDGRSQPRRGIRQRRADRLVHPHLSPESVFFFLLLVPSGVFDSTVGFDSGKGLGSSFPSGFFSPARL